MQALQHQLAEKQQHWQQLPEIVDQYRSALYRVFLSAEQYLAHSRENTPWLPVVTQVLQHEIDDKQSEGAASCSTQSDIHIVSFPIMEPSAGVQQYTTDRKSNRPPGHLD